MPPADRSILILGGTREARELARLLHCNGYAVTTSLAGATQTPAALDGETRRGGFGGAEGLRDYIVAGAFTAVVDATHPFAATITRNASAAAKAAGVPLLRLERPTWARQPGDIWIAAKSAREAAALLPSGARAFVTLGRSDLTPFLSREDVSGVIRSIDPPGDRCPPGWDFIQSRPPFTLADELENLRLARATHLVCKNSGGEDTYAKIIAARELNLPVVIINRPEQQNTGALESAEDAFARLCELLSP